MDYAHTGGTIRRNTLSPRDPSIERLFFGLNVDAELLEGLRRTGKWLWSERNRWSVTQARRGLFSARPLDRQTADRILKTELAALEGGAE